MIPVTNRRMPGGHLIIVAPAPGTGRRQRGVVAVIMAVVMVTIVALVASTAVRMSATGVYDTTAQHDAVEALFLAESALQRASRRFNATPTTLCNNANLDAGVWFTLGRGRFQVVNTFTTNFTGGALPSSSWCRIQVRGQVTSTGMTRTIEGIVERSKTSILPESSNADFNLPFGLCRQDLGCNVTAWNLTSTVPAGRNNFQPWDDCAPPAPGGYVDLANRPNPNPWPGFPAAVNTPCSTTGVWDRAAFARKDWNGSGTSTSGGTFTFSTPIVVTAPITLDFVFDHFLDCATLGGNCNSGNDLQITFRLSTGTETWTSTLYVEDTSPRNAWFRGLTPITITGAGTKTITSMQMDMVLKSGQPKQAWLDDIVLHPQGTPVTATNVGLRLWREIVTL